MQTQEARPTGRRKITREMVIARASRPDEWKVEKKGKCLSAFKAAARALGVPGRVEQLIDYLVGQTKPIDWTVGNKPIAWPSNATLGDRLNLGPTQVKYLIRTAAEFGLVEIQERGNGNRWGYRDASGCIVDACGFDLSPLQARFAEFESVSAEHYARRREGKRVRRRITGLRSQIVSLADYGIAEGLDGQWEATKERAREIGSLRGASYDPDELAPKVAALEGLLAQVSEAVEASVSVSSDPKGPENRPLITSTNPAPYCSTVTRADGPSRPEVTPLKDERHLPRASWEDGDADSKTGMRRGVAESALRGFIVSPDMLVAMAPPFAMWLTADQRATWPRLRVVAGEVRRQLGISPSAWDQANLTFGTQDAIVVLAVIAAKHAEGKVGSAGGLLRAMISRHRSGKLHLDKTLFGLVDGLGASRH